MTPFQILPEAREDLRRATNWYKHKSNKEVHQAFKTEVKKTIAYMRQYPKGFEVKYKEFRGCKTEGFPYTLFYKVYNNRIYITAVLGDRQDRKILDKR